MNQKEQLFYDKLKDIFIGEKIEGASGFANLMRMKSAYFDKVFKDLQDEIENKTEKYPGFREELYNKLYTFLKKYFTDSGSILYKRTTPQSKIYEKVYDNEKDVSLFWKTNMLYYVKTEKIWKPLTIEDYEIEGKTYDIEFDVSELEGKRGNIKKGIIFKFDSIEDNKIIFKVKRPSHGSKTKLDKIRRALNNKDIAVNREDLEHLFNVYEKQNEVDFFINKNAENFLKEQFDLWIKHYVIEGETDFQQERLEKINLLRDIAYKIIEFVSKFEEELVKIWNKPKFVLDSEYVITLDKIENNRNGIKTIERILEKEGFEDQFKEWKNLGLLDESNEIDLFRNTLTDKELKEEYRHLPIDTKHFDEETKFSILSLYENLDEELDGLLIQSENYQALNTIKEKFREDVRAVYIDPPYNTGNEFIYKDKYKHSSWLTMMENRISQAKELLSDNALFFSSIDDNELSNLTHLLEKILGEHMNTIVIRCNPKGRGLDQYLARSHDYLLGFATQKTEIAGIPKSEQKISQQYNHEDDQGRYRLQSLRNTHREYNKETRPNLWYPLYVDPDNQEVYLEEDEDREEVYPVWNDGHKGCWTWDQDKVRENRELLVGRKSNGRWKIYRKDYAKQDGKNVTYTPKTIWDKGEMRTDHAQKILDDIMGEQVFKSPKPPALVSRAIQLSTGDGKYILDFFAGSGTTAQSVIELNREQDMDLKYILIDMGDHLKNIAKPRIKKLVYKSDWKDGSPVQDSSGSTHMFKYYDLEQYEQILKKSLYGESEPLRISEEPEYDQYLFLKDKKMIDALKLDFEEEQEEIDFSSLYFNVDIAETLSNLKGKNIKKISEGSVTFTDGEKIVYDDLDFETIKPLIWW